MRIQYRNDVAFERGTFRVRGDTVEIFPAYEEQGVRIEMWGDEVERISKINPLTGETIAALERAAIYPAKHFVTQRPTLSAQSADPRRSSGRLAELRPQASCSRRSASRSRTNFDIEMMLEVGTLRRDRELLAPLPAARRRASVPHACSTTSRGLPLSSWTSRT